MHSENATEIDLGQVPPHAEIRKVLALSDTLAGHEFRGLQSSCGCVEPAIMAGSTRLDPGATFPTAPLSLRVEFRPKATAGTNTETVRIRFKPQGSSEERVQVLRFTCALVPALSLLKNPSSAKIEAQAPILKLERSLALSRPVDVAEMRRLNPDTPSWLHLQLGSGESTESLFLGLPLAAGAGVLTALLQSSLVEASTPRTRTQVFMAEIQPGVSLQPKRGAGIADPRRPQRFAVWSQAVYEEEIDPSSVKALIVAERAEALEGRLRPEFREKLRKHLIDIDQQIVQIAWQYHEEFERVAALLREQDGLVVIRSHPREKDPLWPEVLAMKKRTNKKEGLVHASYQPSLAPSGWKGKSSEEPLAYVFAAYKEWPIWHRYKEKYDLSVYQRILQTRRWITAVYGKQGMTAFQE